MKKTLNILKVLAEENRLRILIALGEQELCVCQIIALLGLAASTTSKHLSLMYQAGIIDQRKEGRWAYYRVSASWKKHNKLHDWLVEKLEKSSRVAVDQKKLREVLATPLDELCKPVKNIDSLFIRGDENEY